MTFSFRPFASTCRTILRALIGAGWASLLVGVSYAQEAAELSPTTSPVGPPADQCRVLPSWLLELPARGELDGNASELEIRSFADRTQIDRNRFATMEGNVQLIQGDQFLRTDRAQLDQLTGKLSATGGLVYSDGYIAVRATEFHADSFEQAVQIVDSEYVLIPTGAIGRAGKIDIQAASGSREVTLHQGTFTTCPGDRPAWQIRASEITVNENESWGTAHHAQFRIFDVPILYIPRFSFPVTDERKSGFLYPTIRSSSRNGLEVEIPYYLNLAPNYDMTLSPRLMSERGIMGVVEARYLTPSHEGSTYVEYLDSDTSTSGNNSRSLWRVEHATEISSRWSSYLDIAQVSDVAYINDFGAPFANRADPNLYRRAQFDYRGNQTRAQIQIEDFQMLGPYRAPYRTLPRVSVQHEEGISNNLTAHLHSEFSHFRNPINNSDYATRMHVEPSLRYRVVRPAWDWTADLHYLVTHYEQSSENPAQGSTTRALPQFRWHGQVNLERQNTKREGFQTLTPQIQYLYVPFRDQNRIGIYDTILMQDNYHSLFRPRRFTGLDRIADAHQVTIGASTSFFDAHAEELMRFSLGQIIYLDESRTQLFDETSRITASNSEVAAELDFRLSSRWFASSAIQYDTDLSLVRKSRAAIEYRKDDGNLIQLNHRRVRGLVGTSEEVEQAGFLGTWALADDWRVASHWYHDLRSNRAMDAAIGVQYDRCCWSVRVSAYRRVDRNFEFLQPGEPLPPAEFDTGVSLQFILTGLGSSGPGMLDMLQQSIFGYRRPFYLNN
ncbi:LPS assembly protein LptD [Aliidiomarina halalkaliphila]|uniref:LPS-assembly protein LptD n=1 Tax=Aliidiomarina halalkaliphila TaxID=2593535 RepID=A0A552WZY0_9GAMM|nr:LPS assembly protein LptD [Aliidiomarina halalkaliphila]TRW48149.1 LPS assembly protein LptD [Aliidiomarina halalkaliphila]